MDLLAYFIVGSFILVILAHAFMGFALFMPKVRTELKKTSEQYSNTVEQEIAAIKRISNNMKI